MSRRAPDRSPSSSRSRREERAQRPHLQRLGPAAQGGVYADVAERHPGADVFVPPRSTAVPSATAETAPTQRDRHLQLIAEKGRMGWQKASGYNARARAEATVGRFKRVIGDGLRSHTDERRATEMDVAVHVLNRMQTGRDRRSAEGA